MMRLIDFVDAPIVCRLCNESLFYLWSGSWCPFNSSNHLSEEEIVGCFIL